jgi:hypothetical protein
VDFEAAAFDDSAHPFSLGDERARSEARLPFPPGLSKQGAQSVVEDDRMVDDDRDAFSPGFDTARLDAFGPWTADADEESMDINWERPPALQTDWVSFDLRFYVGSGSGDGPPALAPDDRMFELVEMFRARRDEFVGQLRRLTEGYGAIESATVAVFREGDVADDDYTLTVLFAFADDQEHSHEAIYDRKAS